MDSYVAFIRAINVAGHAIIKMTDVRDTFVAAGCRNVRTYIQSGNVVFDSKPDASGIVKKIRRRLRDITDEEPEILLRTIDEVEAIVERAPFKRYESDKALKLYVVFLSETPSKKPPLPLTHPKDALEVIAIEGREAFIVSRRKPNGFYGFPNNFIEKELGVAATSRNWSTVTKIVEFARRDHP